MFTSLKCIPPTDKQQIDWGHFLEKKKKKGLQPYFK